MAVESFLPPVPLGELRPLWRYLQARDVGPPTALPQPGRVVQVSLAAHTIEQVRWGWVEASGEDALRGDGFVLYLDIDDSVGTGQPIKTQLLLPISARSYQAVWPTDAVRSYALAAFRITYAGMSVGAVQTHAAWIGSTG